MALGWRDVMRNDILAAQGDATQALIDAATAEADAIAAQADATQALADAAAAAAAAAAAQATANAALPTASLKYVQVVILNTATQYNAAKPAGWVNGKPCFATLEGGNTGPLTNPVAVLSAEVPSAGGSTGNLVVTLGGVNAGATGDPGANGCRVNVWQDIR